MTLTLDRTHASTSTGTVLIVAGLCSVGLAYIFQDGLIYMVRQWSRPEYGHGYLIPFLSAALILGSLTRAAPQPLTGAATGAVIVALGIVLGLIGELSTIYAVIQGALVITIFGIVLAAIGWRGLRVAWAPMAYLLFMVPLPNFLYANLSADLQLISSNLGVAFIRFAGVPVFLEGNVIDLGSFKLQVVEACSGLRYLFPLMSFGFLIALLYRGPTWHKLVLFLVTIPITIGMNSLRIGITGVLVDAWGIGAAEGFMHYFEGWLIFMTCVGILLAVAAALARLGVGSLRTALVIDWAAPARGFQRLRRSRAAGPLSATIAALILGAIATTAIGGRSEIIPERVSFVNFPLHFSDWTGRPASIDAEVLDSLKLKDHFNADYHRDLSLRPVNLYMAYYDSQRKGEAVHSPRSCIPGGGWQMTSSAPRSLAEAYLNEESHAIPLPIGEMAVNRVVIQKGNVRQIVYYWFKQRDRNLTNEYLVKWFIFWDGLTRQRTDGALVRLVTAVGEHETLERADRRLTDMTAKILPLLAQYIPD